MYLKRGQVAGYILIGIVILLVVSSVYLIQQGVRQKVIQPETEKVLKAPVEKIPVVVHIEKCLESTAKNGLLLLGMHGGYISTERLSKNPYFPYKAEALTSLSNPSMVVPYWWHLSGNDCKNGCNFESKIPPLTGKGSVQEQLQDYIDEHVEECIDFDMFKEMGYDIAIKRKPKSTVIFGDSTTIRLNYPMELSGRTKEMVSEYETSVDVNIPKIWDLGIKIVEGEAKYAFLERHTINVMSGFMGVRKDLLPPMSAYDFKPGAPVFWLRSDVEKSIQHNILAPYVPLFQVVGTANFRARNYSNPFATALYRMPDLTVISPNNTKYIYWDTTVNFNYLPDWPIYVKIFTTAGSGEFLTAEQMSLPTMLLSWLGMKKYTFVYDISYPVLVQIKDMSALDGEGYNLYFAMEANIRKNNILNFTGDFEIPVMRGKDALCNEEQRNSGLITIKTIDAMSGSGVDDVEINYICGEKSCLIGYTTNLGKESALKTKFPICLNGIIVAKHPHYVAKEVYMSTDLDEENNATILLYKEKIINYTVKKKQMVKSLGNWTFRDSEEPLYKNERAMITLTGIDNGYERVFFYYGNNSINQMTLVPGTYEAEITLLYGLPTPYGQDKVIIPREEICYKPSPFSGEECAVINETILEDMIPAGGMIFNNETYYLIVTPDDLYNDSTLVLLTIETPGGIELQKAKTSDKLVNPLRHSDLEMLGKRDELSILYKDSLKPRFERK